MSPQHTPINQEESSPEPGLPQNIGCNLISHRLMKIMKNAV
jgi:hypothetical protein